jgi:hypothetical protein
MAVKFIATQFVNILFLKMVSVKTIGIYKLNSEPLT